MEEYIIHLSGYVKVSASNSDEAHSLALEQVAENPHLLDSETVRSYAKISYQELKAYLPPENLDDVPF